MTILSKRVEGSCEKRNAAIWKKDKWVNALRPGKRDVIGLLGDFFNDKPHKDLDFARNILYKIEICFENKQGQRCAEVHHIPQGAELGAKLRSADKARLSIKKEEGKMVRIHFL